MKQFLKKIIFALSDQITNFSKQSQNEKIYMKFGLDKSVKIYDVSLQGDIKIGHYTYINERSRLDSGENSKVVIGRHCAIGRNVHITSKTHDLKHPTTSNEWDKIPCVEEDVLIGDYVWIGDNAVILPGTVVRDYGVVGANSLVNREVKEFEIVGGTPIRHIRFNSKHINFKN